MVRTRRLASLSTWLGIASLLAMGASHLALTDIWHGEGDLSLEWNVLRISGVILTAFIVTTFVALRGLTRARSVGE
jgi:hypothetical protein